ncbi:hypothetical protein NLX83_38155 [Allokutzneria sp. A3M-2-11 16]|uniref:hypothetical protein n=1 Tax=Allokutzneria sp. A3M-2-11 16 TaxID=2962043 RepID=UPI0020B7204A|nr:hypothetical protein [Allokutzneria sp. A3M-2-11 16]MCP3805105.1 hypothetical protein [Allokutzneria sp. A3M-2-11 16]
MPPVVPAGILAAHVDHLGRQTPELNRYVEAAFDQESDFFAWFSHTVATRLRPHAFDFGDGP